MFGLFKKKERIALENPHEARIVSKYAKSESGGNLTYVTGEKYPMKGNPDFLALKALSPIKGILDKIFSSRLTSIIPFNVSNEKLSGAVQEFAKGFDLLIEAEKLEGNKNRWKNMKKVICVFLEHDMPYRYKLQWMFERMDKEKIKLEESDKYFFRVKNFRVDLEEEKEELFKTYPKYKNKEEMDKFNKWLSTETNWYHSNKDLEKTLEQLVKNYENI